MGLGEAVSVAGATVLVGILIEAIKRAAAWSDATTKRFAPLLSIVLGLVFVEALLAAQGVLIDGSTVAGGVIIGILAGAGASGIYDGAKSLTAGRAES